MRCGGRLWLMSSNCLSSEWHYKSCVDFERERVVTCGSSHHLRLIDLVNSAVKCCLPAATAGACAVRTAAYICCVLIVLCVLLACCRLPLEAESAALGAALQAAAVHSGVPVGAYVQQNQPPISDQVSNK
jgi:hypothetical protein